MTTERNLTADELQEWSQTVAEGLRWPPLAIRDDGDADHVLERILAVVAGAHGAGQAIAGMDLMDVAFTLGSVWGEAVRKAVGWDLMFVTFPEDDEGEGQIAIGPRDRSVICLPVDLMVMALMEPDGENKLMLLYGTIKAGQLPPAVTPGTYLVIE